MRSASTRPDASALDVARQRRRAARAGPGCGRRRSRRAASESTAASRTNVGRDLVALAEPERQHVAAAHARRWRLRGSSSPAGRDDVCHAHAATIRAWLLKSTNAAANSAAGSQRGAATAPIVASQPCSFYLFLPLARAPQRRRACVRQRLRPSVRRVVRPLLRRQRRAAPTRSPRSMGVETDAAYTVALRRAGRRPSEQREGVGRRPRVVRASRREAARREGRSARRRRKAGRPRAATASASPSQLRAQRRAAGRGRPGALAGQVRERRADADAGQEGATRAPRS